MVTGTRVLLYPKLSIEYQKVLRVEIITPSTQPSFELWNRQSIGLKSAFSLKQSIFRNQWLLHNPHKNPFFSSRSLSLFPRVRHWCTWRVREAWEEVATRGRGLAQSGEKTFHQEAHIWAQSGSNWNQMGQFGAFLSRIPVSVSQNLLKSEPKKSPICPVWC